MNDRQLPQHRVKRRRKSSDLLSSEQKCRKRKRTTRYADPATAAQLLKKVTPLKSEHMQSEATVADVTTHNVVESSRRDIPRKRLLLKQKKFHLPQATVTNAAIRAKELDSDDIALLHENLRIQFQEVDGLLRSVSTPFVVAMLPTSHSNTSFRFSTSATIGYAQRTSSATSQMMSTYSTAYQEQCQSALLFRL